MYGCPTFGPTFGPGVRTLVVVVVLVLEVFSDKTIAWQRESQDRQPCIESQVLEQEQQQDQEKEWAQAL